MPYKSGDIVLVDTNVILEAYRTNCWRSLAEYFRFHTVSKVIEETQTGYQNRRPEQLIDQPELIRSLSHIEDINEEQRYNFNMKYGHPILDEGEKDLLIYADSLEGQLWLLNSPDTAAIRFSINRGWNDQVISLSSMTGHLSIRLTHNLRDHYTEPWLSQVKTRLTLGIG